MGFKLHLLVTLNGLILDFALAPASASDLTIGQELLAPHADLEVLGDKAFISANVAAELAQRQRIILRTIPRANQKQQLPPTLRRLHNRVRQIIETVNGQLADQFQIETNHAHTFWGLCARLLTKLTAHTLSILHQSFTWAKPSSFKLRPWLSPTSIRPYYDFTWGPVHMFSVNSNTSDEPDGTSSTSTQGTWLQNGLAASTSPWNLVYFHHPPYASATPGSESYMRWPFKAWGATATFSGDSHVYERLIIGDFPYFISGHGGGGLGYFRDTVPGSEARYNLFHGAIFVTADDSQITFEAHAINVTNNPVDSYTIIYDNPGVNDQPLAVDDEANTNDNVAVIIDVAANDSDVDGNLDVTSVTVTSPASNGTANSNGDGTVTYTPNTNFLGTDSFTYEIADSNGLTDTATVTVEVTSIYELVFTTTNNISINGDSPNSFATKSEELRVDASPIYDTLLEFNVTGIGTETIDTAILRVYTVQESVSGGDVYGTDNSVWDMDAVTWNTAPVIDEDPVGSLGVVSLASWHEVDVTSLITGDGLVTLRISSTSTDRAHYASTRNTPGYFPELVVNLVPPVVSGTAIINEVNADGVDAIELYNPDASPVDLTDWHLIAYDASNSQVVDYTLPSFTLNAGSYVVIHESAGTDDATNLYINSSIGWGDTDASGAAALTNDSGVGVDFVRFGDSTVTPPAGTTWTGSNPARVKLGETLGRDASSTDTNDGADWCRQNPSLGAQNAGCFPPPANDDIASPTVISGTFHNETVDLRGATNSSDPVPSCATNVNNSAWYEYTPSINLDMELAVLNASFSEIVVSLWSGSPGSLSEVTCDNGASPSLQASLTGGTTYYIMIAGENGDSGTVEFSFLASAAQMTVEYPAEGATVANGFNVSGWAVDPAVGASSGPGIDLIRVYDDNAACTGANLGEAAPSVDRPDVQANLSLDSSYLTSGFSIPITPVGLGSQTFVVCARQTGSTGSPQLWAILHVVNVTVDDALAANDPDITVSGNGIVIADGDTTPSAADDTDFDLALVSGMTNVHTFTIENTVSSTQNLTVTGLSITGTDAADFTHNFSGPVVITPGNTSTFDVTFDPSATGTRTATITITHDGPVSTPYNFDIQGEGVEQGTEC